MLNILIGVFSTILFFLCIAVAFYFGVRWQKRTVQVQLSEEERREQERQIKGLQNIIEYDYDVAIGKRVQK